MKILYETFGRICFQKLDNDLNGWFCVLDNMDMKYFRIDTIVY